MDKESFNIWNQKKQKISLNFKEKYFYDREIWWCYFGKNIWFESNWKWENFLRPWIIFKKINRNTFFILPLTTSNKEWFSWFTKTSFLSENNELNFINLMQIRVFDKKRLFRKAWKISINEFENIKKEVQNFLCTS